MKYISTFFLLCITSFNTFAQLPKNDETGKIIYTEVIELPNLNKNIIYNKAKTWIVSTLKSGDNMVELDGTNSNQIVGTGNLILDKLLYHPKRENTFEADASLNFKFIVFCKDGKLKYNVENFTLSTLEQRTAYYHKSSLENLTPPPTNYIKEKHLENWRDLVEKYLDEQIKVLITDFVNYMKVEKDDDW